ncbi:Molybdopterin converting factor, large subunit [Mycetohabitans rhizoxinica HKI 454]|jgi:molybdopterin synthase catalytic subunit|uniref:Molybdopterin synthase catalytic subunit n=2 Tax=Mycetohabitans rhizoxinica TaxID=412963 RepID=E5AQQ0_MYCRK|nr:MULTISPECIES: molybdenum cofactor biosynthesis protein MoaE [Mycetohabitans]MCG1046995.1 molybdenum cofactor biosynthesis protein MoaE [Mycetohabitans sp. B6]CBW74932.1 Molybdopterin converting factor, large subunit [Mycetohabitans rhizoxinica HKI 454]
MTVSVQARDFDVTTELARLRARNPRIGAVVSFVGTVRELSDGESISALELEHYPGMTERALEAIVAEAERRWAGIDVCVVHRYGRLDAGEQIVLVAVAAAHRGDAFAACEFVMDYLKSNAPFWKKERTEQGERWVDARATDDAALARWGIASHNAAKGPRADDQ